MVPKILTPEDVAQMRPAENPTDYQFPPEETPAIAIKNGWDVRIRLTDPDDQGVCILNGIVIIDTRFGSAPVEVSTRLILKRENYLRIAVNNVDRPRYGLKFKIQILDEFDQPAGIPAIDRVWDGPSNFFGTVREVKYHFNKT